MVPDLPGVLSSARDTHAPVRSRAAAAPRRTLADFKDRHRGATIVVCGCGESLRGFQPPAGLVTIGVNDVGRQFTPDYLVVVNPPSQFKGDRFDYVRRSGARFLFTQLELGLRRENIIRFQLGRRGGTEADNPSVLHYTQNSPYVAVGLAAHLGATRIGLLGVDFSPSHFFGGRGPHPLNPQLPRINSEYDALRRALAARGVDLVNLSPISRLTALPRQSLDSFLAPTRRATSPANTVEFPAPPEAPERPGRRVFFVNYRFLACGDVFATGLAHAADTLGIPHASAWWDDPQLPAKLRAHAPDLVLVVHGRRFAQRWAGIIGDWNTAVWLLDEPYEVDDTARWSSSFKTVLVNDPTTLGRHRNAHYLPTCFDPRLHFDPGGARDYGVGFVGGYNPVREKALLRLADRGLLSYVVGGPWQAPALKKMCRAGNRPPAEVAHLYQRTRIVLNVFRSVHHFNRQQIAGSSLNPRIFEALACGALVVTEPRPELNTTFPSLPVFNNLEELPDLLAELLTDDARRQQLLAACAAVLAKQTYADRLDQTLALCCPTASRTPRDRAQIPELIPSAPQHLPTDGDRVEPTSDAITPALPAMTLPAVPVPATARRTAQPPPGTLRPFSSMPRRNLIYHVWPVRNSLWRWNLDQLCERIDLFNGRRVIGIVHDARSEAPEAVMEHLAGQGCEFVVRPNGEAGEALTFGETLARVASDDPDEVTFYGHAKGVKYGANPPAAVRRWVQTLYTTLLDDWVRIRDQLQRYAMTGAFKRPGRFRTHRESGDWHYSGTFFWLRHQPVFRRNWERIPQFYYGVEAWPGTLFPADETGCLFLDGLSELPYDAGFWRRRGDAALARWLATRQSVPVPRDLEHPVPPAPEAGPRMEQKPGEFTWLTGQLLAASSRRVLTIGAAQGGVEWWLARAYHAAGRPLDLTVIEPDPGPVLTESLADARTRFGAQIQLLQGRSGDPEIRSRLDAPMDAVFIDGDHRYAGVRADWELARAVRARQVAFHDIVDSDWHVQCRCCVDRLWRELKAAHDTVQQADGTWGGVGVVRLPQAS